MNGSVLHKLYQISLAAGKEIMDVYAQDFEVEHKEDASPLTVADNRSHELITNGLKAWYPVIPVLSEEGKEIPYSERRTWSRFWLVDPLDGTKEFIKRNGEFTVNIALIEGGYPSLGAIYAPVLDTFYFGKSGLGAFKLENASKVGIADQQELICQSVRLPQAESHRGIRVVASRSHRSPETEAFIQELVATNGEVEVVSSGSSLKFCLVAEGKADYYPRYAPTMAWDTGAGQAIVEAAGVKMIGYRDQTRLSYDREDLLNDWFLVSR